MYRNNIVEKVIDANMILHEPISGCNSPYIVIKLFFPPALPEHIRAFTQNAGMDEGQTLIFRLAFAFSQDIRSRHLGETV